MFSATTTTQRIRDSLLGAALAVACLVGLATTARGQEPADSPRKQSQAEADLTEGLLDLLTEPTAQPTDAQPPAEEDALDAQATLPPASGDGKASGDASSSPATTPPGTPGMPESRGLGASGSGESDSLDGEDLGADRANPLAEVRLGMLTAAGWLRERGEVDKTQQLQRDIVARLDQLIADLDQQTPAPSPSQSPTSSGDAQPQPPQSPEASQGESSRQSGGPSGKNQGTEREQTDREQAAGEATNGQPGEADGSGTQGQPSPGGRERSGVVVDLNDPTALQRSVWGNLPDRVREQMQSRMVERFLPGYREEIEAYYRALSR